MTPFWKREDLYTENGECCYKELCGECDKDPKTCETWDALYDAECQADEIYFDLQEGE
jgi:hypothetical protein